MDTLCLCPRRCEVQAHPADSRAARACAAAVTAPVGIHDAALSVDDLLAMATRPSDIPLAQLQSLALDLTRSQISVLADWDLRALSGLTRLVLHVESPAVETEMDLRRPAWVLAEDLAAASGPAT